jgi:hypothetical protein
MYVKLSLLVLPAGPYEPSGDGALVRAGHIPASTKMIFNYSIIDVVRSLLTYCLYLVFISYLWTYDLYGPVYNAFDAGKSITRASGALEIETFSGPGNRDFFGPRKSRFFRALLNSIEPFGAQKKWRFPGLNPLSLTHGMTWWLGL